ncbi:type II secretion system F family protein [Azonexus hydrophilus]|uniref:type II secretion system F family protein n=1 Tax=Azonexus hydrophilus TaxID=418702 RepID=UPI00042656F2|nr:type II secretion system F family protein [Azonexus hydrophilus]
MIDQLPWLVAASVALGVIGAGSLLFASLQNALRKLEQKRRFEAINRMLDPGAAVADAGVPERFNELERFMLRISGRLPVAAAGDDEGEERRLLTKIGIRGTKPAMAFQTARWVFLVLVLVVAATYTSLSDSGNGALRMVAAGIAAYLLPRFVLRFLAHRRHRQLEAELPVFIDFLRMMHSVGVSFEQAINLFAENPKLGLPVLSSELAVVASAIRSGRSRTEALQLMARQMDVEDLTELVALITHTDYYGAAVQEPLRKFSQRLTERRRFEAQEYVGKLATRMVVVMVVFLLPALMLVTAGPGFVAVFKALGGMS